MRSHVLIAALTTALAFTAIPAWAQLSIPDAFTTQFDTAATPSPLDLSLTRFPAHTPDRYVTISEFTEVSDRTNQSGRGLLDNIHANGRYVVGGITLDRHSAITLLDETGSATDNIDDSSTLINASGNLNRSAIYYTLSLPHSSRLRFGLDRQDYSGGGLSNLYRNTFGIFPQTPPFTIQKQLESASVDYLAPTWRGWDVEGAVDRERAPGRIYLASPSTLLQLPLSDDGSEAVACLSRTLSTRYRIVYLRARGSWSGSDSIFREDNRSIGEGRSRRTQDDAAAGLLITRDKTRRYAIYYDVRHDTWDASGLVTSGENLGLAIPIVGGVHYDASYDLLIKSLGAYYEHDFRPGQQFHIGYKWVLLYPLLESDYAAEIIFLSANGASTTGGDWMKGHELDASYTLTHKSASLKLTAVQAIPVTSHSSSSSSSSGGVGPGGTPLGPRKSDGGRTLQAEFTLTF